MSDLSLEVTVLMLIIDKQKKLLNAKVESDSDVYKALVKMQSIGLLSGFDYGTGRFEDNVIITKKGYEFLDLHKKEVDYYKGSKCLENMLYGDK